MPKAILVVKGADINPQTKALRVVYDMAADNGYTLTNEVVEVTATTSVTQLNINIKNAGAARMLFYAWGTFATTDITIFGGAQ